MANSKIENYIVALCVGIAVYFVTAILLHLTAADSTLLVVQVSRTIGSFLFERFHAVAFLIALYPLFAATLFIIEKSPKALFFELIAVVVPLITFAVAVHLLVESTTHSSPLVTWVFNLFGKTGGIIFSTLVTAASFVAIAQGGDWLKDAAAEDSNQRLKDLYRPQNRTQDGHQDQSESPEVAQAQQAQAPPAHVSPAPVSSTPAPISPAPQYVPVQPVPTFQPVQLVQPVSAVVAQPAPTVPVAAAPPVAQPTPLVQSVYPVDQPASKTEPSPVAASPTVAPPLVHPAAPNQPVAPETEPRPVVAAEPVADPVPEPEPKSQESSSALAKVATQPVHPLNQPFPVPEPRPVILPADEAAATADHRATHSIVTLDAPQHAATQPTTDQPAPKTEPRPVVAADPVSEPEPKVAPPEDEEAASPETKPIPAAPPIDEGAAAPETSPRPAAEAPIDEGAASPETKPIPAAPPIDEGAAAPEAPQTVEPPHTTKPHPKDNAPIPHDHKTNGYYAEEHPATYEDSIATPQILTPTTNPELTNDPEINLTQNTTPSDTMATSDIAHTITQNSEVTPIPPPTPFNSNSTFFLSEGAIRSTPPEELSANQSPPDASSATVSDIGSADFNPHTAQYPHSPTSPIISTNRFLDWNLDSQQLLNNYKQIGKRELYKKSQSIAHRLQTVLKEFNIEAEIVGIRVGPVVTVYEVLPAPGVKVTRVSSLSDNIALRLAAPRVRIEAPIPGKQAIGIEIPNAHRQIVGFRELIESQAFNDPAHTLPIALGQNISGEPHIIELTESPHLLIAGATGSGKSVCVNSIISSLLFYCSPHMVRMVLIDPKIVELKLYNDIPHLITPVVTDPVLAIKVLEYCLGEMEERYALLDQHSVRDISSYNTKMQSAGEDTLPYIVIIIDEFADLMATAGKKIEALLVRLTAMSRAVGIHLVLATQRPSTDVITGLIKANIPSRVAFMVSSKIDSRIILDISGAEQLLGKGDMLYISARNPHPLRLQGALVTDDEVMRIVQVVQEYGPPQYIDEGDIYGESDDAEGAADGEQDPLFEEAVTIVLQSGKASASFLQRRLQIGYNRAARLIEEMERQNIVGPANGSKAREILYPN